MNTQDPERDLDPTNLYLANMPLSWTEDDLRVLIGQFGTVISTYVMRDSGMNHNLSSLPINISTKQVKFQMLHLALQRERVGVLVLRGWPVTMGACVPLRHSGSQ